MRKKTLNLRDLFVEPNFDESKSIAVDSKGRLKRLTKEQLDSVRKTGEFEVSVSSLAKNIFFEIPIWHQSCLSSTSNNISY